MADEAQRGRSQLPLNRRVRALGGIALLTVVAASGAPHSSARDVPAPRILPDKRMLEYSTRIAGVRTQLLVNWGGKASLSGGGDRGAFYLSSEKLRWLRREFRSRHPAGNVRSRDRILRDLLYRTRRPSKQSDAPIREVPATESLTLWPKECRMGQRSRPVSDRNWRFVKRLDRLVGDLRSAHPR